MRYATALLILVLAAPVTAFSADKSDPRFTPAGERRIIELTRWLEENPLGDLDKSRRTEVMKWWVEAPGRSLDWCADLLFEGKNEAAKTVVTSQALFGAGAYLLEHPDKSADQLAISLAGVESALRAYGNAVKKDPAVKDADYEALASKVGTAAMTEYVKGKLKACAESSDRAK